MMGVQDQAQNSLFHFGVNLDKRIRNNHPLRKVDELIDFHFVYDEVKSSTETMAMNPYRRL